MTKTKTKKRVGLNELDKLASRAPKRHKVDKDKVTALLTAYRDNEQALDEHNQRAGACLLEREKLARAIVKAWGKGVLIFGSDRYMPATNHGKIVLRKLSVLDGVLK